MILIENKLGVDINVKGVVVFDSLVDFKFFKGADERNKINQLQLESLMNNVIFKRLYDSKKLSKKKHKKVPSDEQVKKDASIEQIDNESNS